MVIIRKQFENYPKAPFFVCRFLQLSCSGFALGVLSYFQYYLWADGFSNPWEFSLLDFAASMTTINVFITSLLICCCRVSSLLIIIVDGLLAVLWGIGFATLTKAMGKTTIQSCTIDNWGNSEGIRVCHLFKALFAFSFLSLVIFIGSFVAAMIIRKRENRYQYQPTLNPANKLQANKLQAKTAYEPLPSNPEPMGVYSQSAQFAVPQPAMQPHPHYKSTPYYDQPVHH